MQSTHEYELTQHTIYSIKYKILILIALSMRETTAQLNI